MKCNNFRVYFILALTLLMSLCFADDVAPMKDSHFVAVNSWLVKNNKYRLATIDDCDCADGVLAMRQGSGDAWKPQPSYQPYYVASDLNGDNVEDFAVVVKPIDKEKGALVLVFIGKANGRYSIPLVHRIRDDSIVNIGLFLSKSKEKPVELLVGAFFSEGEVVPVSGVKGNP